MKDVYFIINTNSYVGDFHRELTAYVTRQPPPCGVGDSYAEVAEKELSDDQLCWLRRTSVSKQDEDSDFRLLRPSGMRLSPDNKYNSVEIYFNETPTQKMYQLLKDRAMTFCEGYWEIVPPPDWDKKERKPIKVKSFQLLERVIQWNKLSPVK